MNQILEPSFHSDPVQTKDRTINNTSWKVVMYKILIDLCTNEQVIMVPLFESLLGAMIPARTWFGVFMSVLGIAMLECSGSPPNVRTFGFPVNGVNGLNMQSYD